MYPKHVAPTQELVVHNYTANDKQQWRHGYRQVVFYLVQISGLWPSYAGLILDMVETVFC